VEEHITAIQSAIDAFEESGYGFFAGDVLLFSQLNEAMRDTGVNLDDDVERVAAAAMIKGSTQEHIGNITGMAIYAAKQAARNVQERINTK
jgi:hypothetical protein